MSALLVPFPKSSRPVWMHSENQVAANWAPDEIGIEFRHFWLPSLWLGRIARRRDGCNGRLVASRASA